MSFIPVFSPFDLQSDLGAEALARVREMASPAVAAAASRLARVFSISSPLAPGFRAVGAEIALGDEEAAAFGAARASVTGNGESVEAALVSCLGEACEFLSQFERPGDVAGTDSKDGPTSAALVSGGWIADAITHARQPLDWTMARDFATGTATFVPADLCLRRLPDHRAIAPAGPLSAGVAAGPSFEAAATRAILELCERDAAALWWLAGQRPRGFPLEHEASRVAAATIERLRQGMTARRTWILDIMTDIGVPTVAAISLDDEGRGLACGLAARLDVVDAVNAALLELCQMELSGPVASAKRAEAGDAALNEADRRHLRRVAAFAADCAALHPMGCSVLTPSTPPIRNLDELAGALSDRGIAIFLQDLSRADIGVPVVRALSPSLQPFATGVSTERFRRMLALDGGAEVSTAGIPLM